MKTKNTHQNRIGALSAVSLITLLALSVAASKVVAAPSASNYSFSTATNASFTDMSSGTTQLIGPDVDDTATALTNIGFDFFFDAIQYSQFSVNDNGLIRLGGVVQTGAPYKALDQHSIPLITAVGSNQRTHAVDGKVHYKVLGTAPNRTLVIEWLNNQSNFAAGGTADMTYQVTLFETTGAIQFVYGGMTMSAAGAADNDSKDPHIGFSWSNIPDTV